MLHGFRLPLLCCVCLPVLTACSLYSYSGDTAVTASGTSTTAGGTTTSSNNAGSTTFTTANAIGGTHDVLAATASTTSVAVVVGGSGNVSITFTSSDGLPMTGLAVAGAAGGLPAGWSAPNDFNCAVVTTGSGCVLNLEYSPTAVDSGTLTINYVVVDNSGLAKTDGSVAIAYTATSFNNVVAAASLRGEVDAVAGGSASVIVNFTTDDGNPATDLAVTTDFAGLPVGWTSATPTLTCPLVATGNGCQLTLNYAAAAAGSGVVNINYSYIDDSGAAKFGSLAIPYRATTANSVIATASPSGQIVAVQPTGGQTVAVGFTTDDGKPASQLKITSDLTKLPADWSTAASSFACAAVSTGNGCLLSLKYAPTALGGGSLSLTYTYTDTGGAAKSGLLTLSYAATSNDNLVATASPMGQIDAVVGSGARAVSIAFTTDDKRAATSLSLTNPLSSLPAGWSSPSGTFACEVIDITSSCILSLKYTPAAPANGTLSLGYTYVDNAGGTKTGTVTIPYRATIDDDIVATTSQSSVSVHTGSTNPITVTFASDDLTTTGPLTMGTDLGSLPTGWSAGATTFTCATVYAGNACTLSLTYAPTAPGAGTLTLVYDYTNASGMAKSGSAMIAYSATP